MSHGASEARQTRQFAIAFYSNMELHEKSINQS